MLSAQFGAVQKVLISACLIIFGIGFIYIGSSFLNFAQHLGLNFMKCFAKFFGHRSQNNSQGCFAHCVRLPHGSSSIKIKDRRTYVRLSFILVDPRGVEPLSENLLIQPSPSAVRFLKFPSRAVNGQTARLGSHFLHGGFNGERPAHVHRLHDAQSEVAILLGGTGGIMPRHCP